MPLRHAFKHLARACMGLALLGAAGAALADGYPDRPVKWIVPFPPGGAMDSIARTLGESMGKQLNTSFIVENRAGAGGNIGAASVARSKPDGYTILIVANGMAVNPALYADLNYDPIKDFAPISLLAVVPNVLVTNPARNDVKSVDEVIAKAKAQPNHYTYASAGVGTSIHLAGELFVSMAKIDMLHVPYKGSGPAMTDLMGGQVLSMIETVPAAQASIKAGKLRALAVTSAQRVEALPDVPTAAEAGLPGFEVSSMFGIVAPAGTPAPVIERLNGELKKILAKPAVKASLLNQGAIAEWTTPADARARVSAELARWTKVIDEAGVKPE